ALEGCWLRLGSEVLVLDDGRRDGAGGRDLPRLAKVAGVAQYRQVVAGIVAVAVVIGESEVSVLVPVDVAAGRGGPLVDETLPRRLAGQVARGSEGGTAGLARQEGFHRGEARRVDRCARRRDARPRVAVPARQ